MTVRFALLFLLCLVACGPRPAPLVPGTTAALAGTVVSVDLSPLAYDGDALAAVRTEAGGTVTVRVPARVNLCEAEGLGLIGDLEAGAEVEVRGEVNADGDVTPCRDAGHYLRLR